ncbi:HCP-like superfamily protein with MYND-type zinc finger [Rhynchospora pubera]|uniref:HCP-like superfamily protein with MYND-type zinc finger n=1 Tax=Rhynchospora pubera TaxID=906938 RepID=A0AAV8CP55_9POAL|nr:HCP-like superfamily protein with MYND-type zinc finger [Rhynchospora pubera]
MRTRSGSLYPKDSMAIESTHQSACNFSPLTQKSKSMKRKRKHEKQPMDSAIDLDISSLFQFSKRPRSTCIWLEGANEVDHRKNEKRVIRIDEHRVDVFGKRRRNRYYACKIDFLDALPDDLVLAILCKVSASAESASDIINARLACKRFNELGQHSWVLSKASVRSLSVRPEVWSDSAHCFMKMCAEAGNLEACYILGMIYFYCLNNRRSGAGYMAKAAMGSHASALYSLAIIQFNGSGGSKADKDLRAGVTLCARAAFLGHVDALRELGHCLQDGYGIRRQVEEGRRLLCKANELELAYILTHYRHLPVVMDILKGNCQATRQSGFSLPAPDSHPVNRFLVGWFKSRERKGEAREKEGIRSCSHVQCGRVETRRHEFRRCSVCGKATYCSRGCQGMDWKRAHRHECVPTGAGAPPVGGAAQMGGLAGVAV